MEKLMKLSERMQIAKAEGRLEATLERCFADRSIGLTMDTYKQEQQKLQPSPEQKTTRLLPGLPPQLAWGRELGAALCDVRPDARHAVPEETLVQEVVQALPVARDATNSRQLWQKV